MKRVYLVDYDLCSHSTCGRPCITKCPISISNSKKKPHQKKDPVPIRLKKSENRIIIKSEFCLKCGVCINVCPNNAIYSKYILDEPDPKDIIHIYPSIPHEIQGIIEEDDYSSISNENNRKSDEGSDMASVRRGFRLYGLPHLVPGRVTGLCGPNGIGKTTVLNILSGKIKPNLGDPEREFSISDLRKKIKKKEMVAYFRSLNDSTLKVAYKEQVLRILFDKFEGKKVMEILLEHCDVEQEFFNDIIERLDILPIADRTLHQCSGGELQRFAIAMVLIQNADCYLIDEPCTFLDIKKRIDLARLLRDRAEGFGSDRKYPLLVVEHDLTILDFLSDSIHFFYGKPHQFGVVATIQSTKAGINSYLKGYLKSENIQFRDNEISFKRTTSARDWTHAKVFMEYGAMTKTFKSFKLEISPGKIYEGEILVIIGQNGTGKSTFAKILAGIIKSDKSERLGNWDKYISYKPQYITNDIEGNVKEFIANFSHNYDFSPDMLKLLYKPMGVHKLFDTPMKELSGGQLQRVYICACLAKRANLYIIDEPSAYLDVEERLKISSIIRTMTRSQHATTICIEHDLAIIDALADRLLLFMGKPGVHGKTVGPLNKREGMNQFLKLLDVTFRRDEETGRARLNKKGSTIDLRQRTAGEYFYSPRGR